MVLEVKNLTESIDSKESMQETLSSIPGLGRCPGEGNGNPLQYSCLEYPMDRGAWWATVPGVAEIQTQWSTHNVKLWHDFSNMEH